MLLTSCPKRPPRKKVKARRARVESKVAQAVRALCVLRDGDCRLHGIGFGDCGGESEWAHLNEHRRFLTRGKAPEQRHTTEGSLMLCTTHHARLDGRERPRIEIRALSSHGADGRLFVYYRGLIYTESADRVAGVLQPRRRT